MVLLLNGSLCDNVRHDDDNGGDEGVKVMLMQMTMMRIASEIECSGFHALNLPPLNRLISCNAFIFKGIWTAYILLSMLFGRR